MAEITIRRAEPDDYRGIARIFTTRGAAAGTMQNPYPSEAVWKERLAKNAADAERNIILVALAGGELVGHAGLNGNGNPRRAHAWHLGIAIRDDWQAKGIGTKLMAALIDFADNWVGALRVELTVFVDNVRAKRLYERFGFVEEGVLRGYALREGRLTDVITMARFHPQPPMPSSPPQSERP